VNQILGANTDFLKDRTTVVNFLKAFVEARDCYRASPDEPSAPDEMLLTTQLTYVQGPLARSVRDLRLGLGAMAARDPRDPWVGAGRGDR
jgi:hypothetical protein